MPLYEGVGVVADRHAVIIDLGAAYTKCGFATERSPRFILPAEINNAKTDEKQKVIDFNRSSAEQRSMLVDFLFQIYFKKLLVNPKERRVVFCESVLSPTNYRNMVAEVLFNHFEVPSLVFLPTHLAACFPLGTQSALVVDIGYTETLVLPIYEGIPMLNCWQVSSIGQKSALTMLASLLKRFSKVKLTGEGSLSQYPEELLTERLLEDIKTRTCFATTLERSKILQDLIFDEKSNEKIQSIAAGFEYPISGDHILEVDGIVREATCEIFFRRGAERKSITQLILDAVLKCPIDLRRLMIERIHVIGGACMCPGFLDRLKMDLFDLLKDPNEPYCKKMPVNTIKFFKAPGKPNYTAWLGASIFGGLEILPHRSVNRDQFTPDFVLPDWTSFICSQQDTAAVSDGHHKKP